MAHQTTPRTADAVSDNAPGADAESAAGAADQSATNPGCGEPGADDTNTELARQRTRLAEERTHLAWVRTAASVVALGLAVAKLAPSSSPGAGAAAMIVVTGLALLAYTTRRHHLHAPAGTRPSSPVVATGALGVALLTASVLLACTASGEPLAREVSAHLAQTGR